MTPGIQDSPAAWPRGGAFLLGPCDPASIFTPEDLNEEQRAIGQLVDEFWKRDVAPHLVALLRHEPGVGRSLLLQASSVGLTALHVPEEYGGADLDLLSVLVAAEHLAEDGSYSGWHMGHAGIGTLPIVWFGTESQRRKYLPRLATADLMAAYALTEPGSGSDALGLTTRADLTPDGRAYVLTGQKMWITGGAVADIFIVFAKVGGEHLTAFIVERDFGVRSGAEEHKMGLSGTSTTALYLDGVTVPVDNVLGEIGRGHRIAFSVLNSGRLMMGPLAIRGARRVLQTSVSYASTRRAFGRPIAHYGAIRELLSVADVSLFAVEACSWRTGGLIEAERRRLGATGRLPHEAAAAAFDEFAAECAIVKVAASEMLDRVADHGVQVHGGYGYHADYFVERAYRDARINRIFEGTNEINRTLIPTAVLKRAGAGDVHLADVAIDHARAFASADASVPVMPPVDRLRTLALAMLGFGLQTHGDALRQHQYVTTRMADAMIETYVAESADLRARRLSAAGAPAAGVATARAAIYARDALTRITRAAEDVIASTADAEVRHQAVMRARQVGTPEPVDVLALHERVAQSLFETGDVA